MNNKEYIISKLLDKYERSKYFREGEKPARKIDLKLYDNGNHCFYDIEQSEQRIIINNAVMELSKQGLISYEWLKGEEGHIISKVWLNIEHIDDAYKYINRRSKMDEIEAICLKLRELQDNTSEEWLKQFLLDTHETIYSSKNIGKQLPKSKAERNDLFKVIEFIDKFDGDLCSERVFSMKCFGDSKQFEKKVKNRLIGILRKYTDISNETTDEDLLINIGISRYPERIEFSGDARLIYEDGAIDFSLFKHGSNVSISDIIRGEFDIDDKIDKIISIENKANYIDYILNKQKKNEFILFHGGQFSPAKKKFLKCVVSSMPEHSKWYHWGDIDYGGFSMLARLRREIFQGVAPYRMNIDEMNNYEQFTASFDNTYADRLRNLTRYPELEDVKQCIEYMINNKKKLEQEAILISD